MIKKGFSLILAIAGFAGIQSISQSQPSFTKLGDVVVSGLETLPTGIVADGDTAYVVGYNQRRVLKIENVTTSTPSSSILARTDSGDSTPVGSVTWQAGRGLITADLRNGTDLLIAGDAGGGSGQEDGYSLLLNAADGTLIQQGTQLNFGGDLRVGHAAFLGTTNIILSQQSGTNFFQANSSLSGLTGAGFYGGAAGSTQRFTTDFVAIPGTTAGTDVYVSFNDRAFTGEVIGIHEYLDDATSPDSFTDNVNTGAWYEVDDNAVIHTSSIGGIGYFDYAGDGTEYLILADRGNAQLHLVDRSNPASVTLFNTDITLPADATVTTVGGNQYLLVTQTDSPSGNGRITVYGVDGAGFSDTTAVSNWELY